MELILDIGCKLLRNYPVAQSLCFNQSIRRRLVRVHLNKSGEAGMLVCRLQLSRCARRHCLNDVLGGRVGDALDVPENSQYNSAYIRK